MLFTYHNSALTEDDVKLLKGPSWLNDNLITFAFEFFEHEEFHGHEELLFMHPSTSFWLSLCDDSDVEEALSALAIQKRHFLLIPITNNMDYRVVGGTHWALLGIDICKQTAYFCDSLSPRNCEAARVLLSKLIPFLHCNSAEFQFKVPQVPQQSNSYDCGLYAVEFARVLGQQFISNSSITEIRLDMSSFSRNRWLKIIYDVCSQQCN